MPARQQGQPIAPDRLFAVLQGWNVTEEQAELGTATDEVEVSVMDVQCQLSNCSGGLL
jgi:hypothetical protein